MWLEDGVAEAGAADGYSDGSFWAKVTRYAASAGREVVEKAFILYFTSAATDARPGRRR